MSNLQTLLDTPNATSSPESECGHTRLETLDGQMILPHGLAPVPVNPSLHQENEKDSLTSGTSGPSGSDLSTLADRQLSSESRSQPLWGQQSLLQVCSHCGNVKIPSEFSKTGFRQTYRSVCKDCRNMAAREWHRIRRDSTVHRSSRLAAGAKARSLAKDLQYDLTPESIQYRLDQGTCEATGLPFDMTAHRTWNTPSLDRINPSLGYTQTNTRVVLFALNAGCGDWGEQKLVHVVSALLKQRQERSNAFSLKLAENLKKRTDVLGSTLFNLTWKERVTQSGRRICALRASGRRTSGSDCTSWPTPNAQEFGIADEQRLNQRRQECKERTGNGNGFGLTLGQAAKILTGWPSPVANKTSPQQREDFTPTLAATAQMATWATPTNRDYRSEAATDEFNEKRWSHKRGKPLSAEATLTDSGQTQSGSTAETTNIGQLNPRFSLWLQGLPAEWASCGERAMLFVRQSRKRSSKRSSS